MKKNFFIHIGNHKTGTTAIQQFLDKYRKDLKKNNLIYPKIGYTNLYPFNNHNIAWELTEDNRLNSQENSLKKLYELLEVTKQNIIISSEDFESLNFNNVKFKKFKETIINNNFNIKIIIYLRNQIDYFSSFYQTILLIGHSTNNLEKIWQSLNNKNYIQINKIKFWFDYSQQIDLIKKIFSLKNSDIICRSYDENKNNLIQNFINIFKIKCTFAKNFKEFDNLNTSMTDLSQKLLQVFNQNHEKYNLSLGEKIKIKDILINKNIFKGEKFKIKDKKLKLFMKNRFIESNTLVEKNFKIIINKYL